LHANLKILYFLNKQHARIGIKYGKMQPNKPKSNTTYTHLKCCMDSNFQRTAITIKIKPQQQITNNKQQTIENCYHIFYIFPAMPFHQSNAAYFFLYF